MGPGVPQGRKRPSPGRASTAPSCHTVRPRSRVRTGQPDFAKFVIDYVPGDWLVESKALKLYLASYRNHGGFHEATRLDIARRITQAIDPVWLRMGGYWYPRGGIPIDVFYQSGEPPAGLWLPDQGVPPYHGR